jgi:diguanylate cyclase (GGDEF)-like protein
MSPELLERLPAALFEIGKLVASDLDPHVLLTRISELICKLIGAHACSVMLLDSKRERLLAKAAYGLHTERVHLLSFAVGEGVAGWVALHGEAVLIDNVADDPRFIALADHRTPIASMICVPLTARGQRVGVVSTTSEAVGAFGPQHLELVQFLATTIALDIENVRLHRVAVTDALTGAYNREFLTQRLPLEIEAASSGQRPLSIALVDIDEFKKVNDAHGHLVGDRVLSEVARRLRGAIRNDDLLVRYGGEEFLAVLPRADAARGWEVGERMRQRVGEEVVAVGEGLRIPVTISVGVAELRFAPAVESGHQITDRADAALYSAKHQGRNRVEVAP